MDRTLHPDDHTFNTPGARHSWAFEDVCAWLAAHATMNALTMLLRITWRTVAAIVTRVIAHGRDTNDSRLLQLKLKPVSTKARDFIPVRRLDLSFIIVGGPLVL